MKAIPVCPKCGSTDWEVADSLSASESMVNSPSMVNNLRSCKSCGYIGVFFDVEEEMVKEVQQQFKK